MRMLKALPVLAISALLAAAPVRADGGADLTKLLRDYREAELKIRPTTAIENGDNRYLDRYDENLTAKYLTERRRINQNARAKLDTINLAQLKTQDGLSYEIFRWALEDETRELKPGVAETFQLLALNQFDGAQITFPREMQWRGEHPFTQVKEYDDNIRRMLGFTRWIDQAIANMRAGLAKGVTQPRVLVERMIAQAEIFANGDPEASLFMAPVRNMPGSIGSGDRSRIDGAYREAVTGELVPAYRRLAFFLKTEYLPHARDNIGLSALPNGKEMYLYAVKSETTSDLTPDAIHALGLKELARIEADMEQVKKEAGFAGTLDQFRAFLKTDPRFKFKDQAAMMAEFNRVKRVVDDHLGNVFATKPKAPLTFRFYEGFVATDRPAAEYSSASADGRRPGIVYLNASELATRPSYTSEVLTLHEGIPGHHLQLAVTMENKSLPRFRRFGSETAFAEGWALYAERLGPELGLYTDPYQKFGELSFDAWRASRLVVDTGIHWLGWNFEQSVQFLMAHTALSRGEAVEEVNRYIAIPGQALSYKIGELEFLDLRTRAKQALGAKFDLKRFHEAVLKDGAMPLPILDAKIGRWIEQEKGA